MSKARKKRLGLPKLKLTKKQKIGIGVGVGLLAVVLVFARKRIPPGFFTMSFLDDNIQPRGIRNNNPGNILANPSNAWEGKLPPDQNTDGKFEQFKTYVYGVRAMIVLIRNYMKQLNTIEQIVYRWNPGNPNYVKYVADRMGIAANAKLTANKQTIKGLVQAIADFENGIKPGELTAISDDVFEAAWSIA